MAGGLTTLAFEVLCVLGAKRAAWFKKIHGTLRVAQAHHISLDFVLYGQGLTDMRCLESARVAPSNTDCFTQDF